MSNRRPHLESLALCIGLTLMDQTSASATTQPQAAGRGEERSNTMTTKVLITHGGGNHQLNIANADGTQVGVLEQEGDEFEDQIHSGSHATFTVSEGADIVPTQQDTAA